MKTTIDLSSPKLLNSLIFLTDEPDEHLYISIANEILAYGTAALPFLKEKIKSISNVFHEERLNNLIYSIEQQSVREKLQLWGEKRENDLMEPYFILSRNRFPEEDWAWIGFQMVMLIEQAEKELNPDLTPLEQVKILNHIIYDVNKFRADMNTINVSDYYYINTLFETHLGNPLSLGML